MPVSATTHDLATDRAAIARAARRAKRTASDEDREAERRARADYAAAKLEEHIRRVVDAAPPLTAEQRDRLALLLRDGDAA